MDIIKTSEAPQAIGPYSQAIRAGEFLFLSGQIPLQADGMLVGTTIEEQTVQVLENIKAILKASGSSLEDVAKVTIFVRDMNHFQTVNQIYGEYFSQHHPARSLVEVCRLPKDVLIEMECIAYVK